VNETVTSEQAVLGHILWNPLDGPALLQVVEAGMFSGGGHASTAALLAAMIEQHLPVDVTTVATRLQASGQLWLYQPNPGIWLHTLMQAAPRNLDGARWHAERVRAAYAGRYFRGRLVQAADALDEGAELDDVIGGVTAATDVAKAHSIELGRVVPTTAADLLAVDPPIRWRVPYLIGHREKVIWTGLEGLGKSELGAQLAVCAAAGLHPFTGEVHDPVRVLVVDLENEIDGLRRRYRRVVTAVERHAELDRTNLMVETVETGMDVIKPDHFARLRRLVDAADPGILFIGPLAKMGVGRSMIDEENAVALCARLDELRVEHDLAVLAEAHPSKEKGGDGQRLPAPRGSSYFLGWPSVGFGLRPHSDCRDEDPPRTLELKRFRGNREERVWPSQITRQQAWPGIPVLPFAAHWSDRDLDRMRDLSGRRETTVFTGGSTL